MPTKTRINKTRVAVGTYIEKRTARGYVGTVKKNGRGKDPVAAATSTKPVPPTLGKRPRLEDSAKGDMEGLNVDLPSPWPDTSTNDTEEFHEELLSRHTGKSSQGKTSRDLMEEWVDLKALPYLDRILCGEARLRLLCDRCGQKEANWRCLNCCASPRFCGDCCRVSHRSDPLHRIERWNGRHWRLAWLWHVGSVVCLGHNGAPCPAYSASLDELEARLVKTNEVDDLESDNTFAAKPKSHSSLGVGHVVAVVHSNGFHHLPIFPCWCASAEPEEMQFLDTGLYPASFSKISTVFTFDLLNKFHLLKVHSHMSTEHFAALLRRFTNPLFPDKSLDRRRELARAWLQWNYLAELKRNGFAHDRRGPGVNLPDEWASNSKEWLFRRYLVVDGNFVLDHLASSGKRDSVPLSPGASFMAEPKRYARHLKESKESTEASTCAELRAVAQKNKLKKGYDATGVVAVACARHGCFAPGGVVDMQKGERHVNVDYAVCQALKTTNAGACSGTRLAYDINCQYSINFIQRVLKSPYLSIPPNKVFEFVIGLFHVHGHKDECLARFAPTFLPGSGVTSGEIIESLWSTMNGAAPITRNMTPSNRLAMLDACIQDSNLRKMQGLASYIQKQLEVALKESAAATSFFYLLNEATDEKDRPIWENQMAQANSDRGGHNTSMDVYNFRIPQVEPKKAVQARLMEAEKKSKRRGKKRKRRLGATKWIATGIEIQESQIALRAAYRAAQGPTASLAVDLAEKSEALANRVIDFDEEAKRLFNNLDLASHQGVQWENDQVEVCVCEEECCCMELEELPLGRVVFDTSSDEFAPLPLPSSFEELPEELQSLAAIEIPLRVSQAEEALEQLRTEIAHKSCLYRAKRQLAGGGRGVTRSYDEINSVEAKMRSCVKIYESARWALNQLGALSSHPRFRPLNRNDTRAITSVYDPNRPGERNTEPSWIWTMNIQGKSPNHEYLKELRRVNWIRAKSRMDRWSEEVLLLRSEVEWYRAYMAHQESRAMAWSNIPLDEGHKAYALSQADGWRRFGMEGRGIFTGAGPKAAEIKVEDADDVDMDAAGHETCKVRDTLCSLSISLMFPSGTLLAVRNIDAAQYQSLVNYCGSRALACSTSLLMKMGMMDPGSLKAMAAAVEAEIGVGDCLLGLGLMIHNDRIYAPQALCVLTPLMVEGKLTEFEALRGAFSGRIPGGDDLLHHYMGNWWTEFTPSGAPYPQQATDIIGFWRHQLPILPPPTPLPPLEMLNVMSLSSTELFTAYAVGEDVERMLDVDISTALQRVKTLETKVRNLKAMKMDLLALEEKAVRSEAEAEVSKALRDA